MTQSFSNRALGLGPLGDKYGAVPANWAGDLLRHAVANYNKPGERWDFVIETWTTEDVVKEAARVRSEVCATGQNCGYEQFYQVMLAKVKLWHEMNL